MIEIYVKSENNGDIELFEELYAIGDVSVSFLLNEEETLPDMLQTQKFEGVPCIWARFPKAKGDTNVQMSLRVRNSEVPLPQDVTGYSETNGPMLFCFAKFSDEKQVRSDWQNAEILMSDTD